MGENSTQNGFSIVGKEFSNEDGFFEAFHDFCNTSYQPFIIVTNNKRQVTLQCRHGYRRASESTGKRTHLRYNYLACPAKITCYKPSKSKSVRITSVNLTHNHEVSKAAFESFTAVFTEKEKQVVNDLHEANCKVSQICRVLHTKFDKNLSSQKVRNLIRKLNPASGDDTSRLQNFLVQMEEDGGTVATECDVEGNVSVIFLSSQSMKKAFLASSCTTVQVDTSFDLDSSKYKLCGFCYLNPTTNCSEISALAFLAEETAVNFRWTFQRFKEMCSESPAIFVVDKDFNDISVLRQVFPTAAILLCYFHVIKYVKNLIATALITVESKNELMNNFKAMMYARTEALYEETKNEFLVSVEGVEVRVGQKYVSLKNQFLKNWDTCKEMWTACHRKHLPTLGDNTNNRIERSFWTLKMSIRDRFPAVPVIQQSVIHLVRFCEDRIMRASTQAALKSFTIYDADPQIHTLNRDTALELNERGCMLFHESLTALKERRQYMSVVDGCVQERYEDDTVMYNCSSTECTCTFYSHHQAPCRHILLKREDDTGSLLSVFCRSLFHERYRKQTSLGDTEIASIDTSEFTDDLLPIDNERTVAKVLTSHEKYKLIIPVAMNIATLASSHGTEQFMTYLSAMREVCLLYTSPSPRDRTRSRMPSSA